MAPWDGSTIFWKAIHKLKDWKDQKKVRKSGFVIQKVKQNGYNTDNNPTLSKKRKKIKKLKKGVDKREGMWYYN